MLRNATITKIEKKIPNILACLLSECFQDKPLVNPLPADDVSGRRAHCSSMVHTWNRLPKIQ
jgi:hypothetical protein